MTQNSLISSAAPDFTIPTIRSAESPVEMRSLSDYAGSWLLLIFYPRDFSFVCPTEITSFSSRSHEFAKRNCQLLALSVDTIEMHAEWLRTSPAEGGIGPLDFPLASDVAGVVAQQYGVWSPTKHVSYRGTFMIDPEGVVQYSVIHNLAVGRSVDETLRVLDALQSGGLCPASWTRADGNLDLENALKPGRVLGHYRIVQALGNGSFGHVLAAWDSRLERSVALKILKSQTQESRAEILSEARAAAPLMHPNICTIYGVEEIDGLLVITMELLDGCSLTDYLTNHSPLAERLRIAHGIAAGLAAAHAEKIVHGDFKPDNIHIGQDTVPHILDFGLAHRQKSTPPAAAPQMVDASTLLQNTSSDLLSTVQMANVVTADDQGSGKISGTPAYMAPERWSNQKVHSANDIYSFGLILFELVTGRRAFQNTELRHLLEQVSDPNLPNRLASELPPELQQLCINMLAFDHAKRPSATEIVEELQAIAEQMTDSSDLS